MLAVYTKRPEILVDQSGIVAEIVGVIRKRIVIRPGRISSLRNYGDSS